MHTERVDANYPQLMRSMLPFRYYAVLAIRFDYLAYDALSVVKTGSPVSAGQQTSKAGAQKTADASYSIVQDELMSRLS